MSKNGLKNKVDGDELDLSMMGLTEVPVKEIASLPKVTKVDLSNNQLVSLPEDFATSLPNLLHLELGSNKLKSLPNNIDKLVNLKTLDLYNNQLKDLPVSLCQLRNLRWLDVKNNPLNAGLKKAAGDCLNKKECELAARKVLTHLKRFHIQMENEKLEKMKKEKEKEVARARAEEELQAKKRAEKKAAKEKRKQEYKAQLEAQKHQSNGSAAAEQKYVAMPKPAAAPPKNKKKKPVQEKGWSCLGWFNLLLFLCLVAAAGAGVYVYTEGNLTTDGLVAAYPQVVKNMNTLANLTVEAMQPDNLKATAQSVLDTVQETSKSAWARLEEHTGDLSPYTDPIVAAMTQAWLWTRGVVLLAYNWLLNNVDWDSIGKALRSAWKFLYDQWLVVCEELSKNEALASFWATLKGYAFIAWEYLAVLWVALCEQLSIVSRYIQEEGPVILASVKEQATSTFYSAKQSIEGLMK